jgi:hypothetical protein
VRLGLSLTFFVVACGTSNDQTTDAGPDVSTYDAGPHPAVPQIQQHSGPVLDAPNVVPIFFKNDLTQSTVEDFLSQLPSSTYWSATTSEYGGGPLTVSPSIVVGDTPPTNITITQVAGWLEGYLNGKHPEWPAIDQNNIYTVFYPSSTTITDNTLGGAKSCVQFGGDHTSVPYGNTNLVFAVIPHCAYNGGLTGTDLVIAPLSHELIESVTNPLSNNPAWLLFDQDHLVWNFDPGQEIADMCEGPEDYQNLVGSYKVARGWSNASALAGHDPCVPVLSTPYFNAAPVLTQTVTLSSGAQSYSTLGVQVPLNQSATIDVQLFSDGPVVDWTVSASDIGMATELTFTWDQQMGNNGDTRQLTITRVANGPIAGSEFQIESTDGTTSHVWYGFASN